jgi:hypothetical protein
LRRKKAMADGGGKAREIDLGEDFGKVVVTANGVRVEIHTDGSILAYTKRSVDAYSNGPAQVVHPANDGGKATGSSQAELKIGDRVADGTIYAGISPDTGKAMYATAKDAPLTYTFNQARKHAEKLDAHGHQDWRVPTKGELNVLFQHRAGIGGFNETGSYPAGWYWSSSQYNYDAWAQRFSDGDQDYHDEGYVSSLRCVR